MTTLAGREIDPAISPDGNRVVFAWNGGEADGDYELYVKQIDQEATLRLTDADGFEGHPVWSPDGSEVAFVRTLEGGAAIYSVPALGGPERRLARLGSWSFGLDWSPDGRWVAYSETEGGGRAGVTLLNLQTLESRALTTPSPRFYGDFKPVFSPDSRRLAFLRSQRVEAQDIYVVDIDGSGEPQPLTRSGRRIRGFDWTSDGEVLFSSDVGGSFGLWKAQPGAGSAVWLPLGERQIFNPSISLVGERVVFESVSYDLNVWRAELGPSPVTKTEPWIGSTRRDADAVFSPAGLRIAFVSDRSGDPELWRSEADGSSPLQLTRLHGPPVGAPRWSPDSSWLAFQAAPNGYGELFVIEAEGGLPRPLVAGEYHALPLAWSASGDSIYYSSDRTGAWQIWRAAIETGESRQLTRGGGISAQEAEDGALYFTRPGDPELYRLVPDDEGFEREPVGLQLQGPDGWQLVGSAVVFARSAEDQPAVIRSFDLGTGEVTRVGVVEDFDSSSFAVSPSGDSLLFGRVENSVSDLMVAELGL